MTATTEPGSMPVDIWPSRVLLNRSQQRQVLDYLREHEGRCPACGELTPEVNAPGVMAAFRADADRYDVVMRCATAPCAGRPVERAPACRRFLRVRAAS